MFSLSELKQTRFYQEAFTEGREEGIERGKQEGARLEKLKTASLLLRLGLSVEQVAQELGLSIEEVRQAYSSILVTPLKIFSLCQESIRNM